MGVSMTMVAIGTPTSVEPSVTTPGHAQIRTQVIAGCRGTARFRRHGLQLEVLGVAAKFRETSWNFRQATAGPCQFRHLVTVSPKKTSHLGAIQAIHQFQLRHWIKPNSKKMATSRSSHWSTGWQRWHQLPSTASLFYSFPNPKVR